MFGYFLGLLEEMSLNSTVSEERQERCGFVQELVLSTMSSLPGEESCEQKFNNLIQSSRTAEPDSAEEDEIRPQRRQSTTVLRGRARQDNQNAKRRADANRKDKNKNSHPEGDR